MASERNAADPCRFAPEAPHRFALLEPAGAPAAPAARALAERFGEGAAPDQKANPEAAEQAERDRGDRLACREVPAERGGGDEQGGGVDERRGEPERHDCRERDADRKQASDQRNDLARAERGEAAQERGQDDHARLAALEGAGDERGGPGRLERRDEHDRRRDVGQGSGERLGGGAEDVRKVRCVEQRHRERDDEDEGPDGPHASCA